MTCPICNQSRLRKLQRIPGGQKLHCKICGHVILHPINVNANLKSIGMWPAGCLLIGRALKEAALDQGIIQKPGSFEAWRVYTLDTDGEHLGWEGKHLGWCMTTEEGDTGKLFESRRGAEAGARICRTACKYTLKAEEIMVERITVEG